MNRWRSQNRLLVPQSRGAVHTLSSRPLETPHPLFPPSLRSAAIPLRQSELPGGTEGRQSDCFDKDDAKKRAEPWSEKSGAKGSSSKGNRRLCNHARLGARSLPPCQPPYRLLQSTPPPPPASHLLRPRLCTLPTILGHPTGLRDDGARRPPPPFLLRRQLELEHRARPSHRLLLVLFDPFGPG